MPRTAFPAHAMLLIATTIVLAVAVPARSSGFDSPICGDVDDSGNVNTSDALLVLRKGVGLDVDLPCDGYERADDVCQADLAAYQPVACPCFAGPATLAAIMQDF